METGKSVRKTKKKQVKDELDRIKQAEKKKRRLEKALATSAAIISELEKKKQKKKEEQQRLDEEGAAIAEAVALQVLIEEEEEGCGVASNFGMFGARATAGDVILRKSRHQGLWESPNEGFGWVFNGCRGYGCGDDGAAGVVAAQAVSSLRISDDEDMNGFVLNRMVRG